MNMADAVNTFVTESEELLVEMEDALLAMEEAPDDEEHLNSVFRAMHTIKGAAGIFNFDHIVSFTHPVETELDKVRQNERDVDSDLIALLLECKDHTMKLIQALTDEDEAQSAQLEEEGQALLERLISVDEIQQAGSLVASETNDIETELESAERNNVDAGNQWFISLQFKQDALRNGLDPLSFINYLSNLGTISKIVTRLQDYGNPNKMDPESCYLDIHIAFVSEADKQTIESVFEFAQEDCDISILPPEAKVPKYMEVLESLPEDEVKQIGEMLIEIGAITAHELKQGLDIQSDRQDEQVEQDHKPIGEILVERKAVDQSLVEKALQKQEKTKANVARESSLIRVDSNKLGQLINLVGELVISSAEVKVKTAQTGWGDLEESVENVEHLVENIRDIALQLRMVPIGDTFSRFRRVVRDVSKDLGKEIDLKITGGESELDKTVVEKINDPLTHLVRNSLDHGIELPEERIDKGKPATGTVHLNAYHDSGHIVIEIKDDGAGLDPERIREKAMVIGLIKPEQELSRQEIFRLAFEPGLSTKKEASKLSGRGVGMDVVRRNIEALRGSVELDSELGKGTTVTIHLPLTLAIIDGFLVGAQKETYVIPLSTVEECVEMDEKEWQVDSESHYVNLRGEAMPYLRLGDLFGQAKRSSEPHRESLVVVRFGRNKAGFVVDELFGEQQTVIKPLGDLFENLKGISGATVLGSGDIALILDVQGLINLAHDEHSSRIGSVH